ncbi:MAG: OmpA family protein, partial [Hyphomicrobiales bacterium]|nr:OmpA family protein [Hyphomicrobiales bacterium]
DVAARPLPQTFDPAPLQAALSQLEERVSDVAARPLPETFDPAPLQAALSQLEERVSDVAARPLPETFDPAPLQAALSQLEENLTRRQDLELAGLADRVAIVSSRLDSFETKLADSRRGGRPRLLGQVYFDSGSSHLNDAEESKIRAWLEELEPHQRIFSVIGYSDNVGATGHNLNLSLRRAVSTRESLIRLGAGSVGVTSVSAIGEFSEAAGTIEQHQDRARNRTVEIYAYD